ncbi:TIGR03087 family PEP-CTERM/XrtA system glycosyltransferase [Janthinobacterium agaricidamnosum]|uniref:Glycosyl transferases group 1 n=1 Tax=Janthinobacterium agaricidamnosum NBRC 102515 = DSM 9628 TaxID=1349767 RepID=W0V5V7_9BURK|nr:TIGR03087 family PEP-CTERM/XrtA system glycosyltransferase [Janthinobacterium agaricidamnosum]CDG83271.1 glycosyl transferases group 1 [Janthinobacterium agaricidamnosum NBRC 102515 = DSM 9628]
MADLLYLVHRIPYPPNKGDKIRSWHVLKYLAVHFRVHLGCFIDDADDAHHIDTVKALCASTCFIRQYPMLARVRSVSGLLTEQPMSLPYYRNAGLQRWVDALLHTGQLRQALVFSGPMAQYLDTGPGHVLQRVIDFVDVDSEKWDQYAATKAWPLSLLYAREAHYLRNYERHIAQQFNASTFVSSAEAALFRQRAPMARRKTGYFNNGVDAAYFAPPADTGAACDNPYPAGRRVLVFTGAMDYWPNAEAVGWFVQRVWPALRLRFPELLFYIAGSRPARQVRALADTPGVAVTGFVADIRPYLAHAALVVAPLRIARGVQNKVLEAMAMQKTVLATPQALQGINAQDGVEVASASDEHEFVQQASRLLTENIDLGPAARLRILQDYSWDKNLQRLGALLGIHSDPSLGRGPGHGAGNGAAHPQARREPPS